MWKAKLNQHFAKFAFLLWNVIFHSLWLSALFFLSNGTNFTSMWSENQILFATLSIGLYTLIDREEWSHRLRDVSQAQKLLFWGGTQAFVIISLITIQAIFFEKIEFLGLSSQIGLNFLSSYSWLFRALLLFALSFAINATTKNAHPHWTGLPLQLFFFWIWFQPGWQDYLLITILYLLHSSILFSTGMMAGIFIMTHAVLGSPFMGTEFNGLLQFKWLQAEDSLLHHPALILGLFFLLFVNKLGMIYKNRKENAPT